MTLDTISTITTNNSYALEESSIETIVLDSSDDILLIPSDDEKWVTIADFTHLEGEGVDIDELINAL